ncbi:Xaa-Pro dipeptidase [Variibacter gotjawalensis]|uniref:Xaa-Pro dipeptidase n=1 Tax=Variibacter gotjawalensis TaxID=1333996 RepID=A0A0S3PU28_9BRAD|nr:aminopeptidase P family protein [Variibacter gotjawalensis]NIK49645.1 Xaa-Pro aminopeptidase [Variibacter gotjawalensis]RZS45657.1 Xaa-Pro aminopeptidase [Variibacter gotjawalensis]BAT59328.1 Xaa-Pro dipeptidase [Variibacter gotjawalensis]
MFEAKFQTFTDSSDRAAVAKRVAALRAELKKRGLDGLVIPHADRQQNEYLPACEERLAWLAAFTGSAGRAIVLADKAALFVDGRYTLQAAEQTDTAVFEVVLISDMTSEAWLEKNASEGAKIGYDPWLFRTSDVEALTRSCASAGASLVACDSDPVETIWTDRPEPPLGQVALHPVEYSGEAAEAKLARVRAEVAKARADALVVSNPTAVAWAFNIRGADVTHTPLALSFAIVPAEGRPSLFVDGRKLSNQVRDELERLADVRAMDALPAALTDLGYKKQTVRLDNASAADAIARMIRDAGGKIVNAADPITLMKAVKNATEISGSMTAHRRDGAAVANFLAWFDREAPRGKLTEIECVAALESFRRDTGLLKDVSFPTISGSGPNGAIVHYRVTEESNRRIAPGELFLLDSGAQYLDGTTDITRTMTVGAPTDEMRDRFTRVLKGHIGIARAIFPDDASGSQLDTFARQHLWSAGLDYNHGTGHGVGSYLSVHEGPASISKVNTVPLKRGMILSNEPGYYKTGAYGIRIENLVLVVEAPKVEGAEKPLNCFETITLAPIDQRLVLPSLLTAEESAWFDAYHARVRAEIGPLVEGQTAEWLENATAPLGS